MRGGQGGTCPLVKWEKTDPNQRKRRERGRETEETGRKSYYDGETTLPRLKSGPSLVILYLLPSRILFVNGTHFMLRTKVRNICVITLSFL